MYLVLTDLTQILFFICFSIAVIGVLLNSVFLTYIYFHFTKFRKSRCLTCASDENDLPYQIVQLPVFNENADMVERLVDSACALEYPHDRLYIQLLDDSDLHKLSDCLSAYIREKKSKYPDLNIYYFHRTCRFEFKAGNLNNGIEKALNLLNEKGINDSDRIIFSIFDADFIIPPNYLKDVEWLFGIPRVGAVQAIPVFENENENIITKTQAVFLGNLYNVDFSTRSRCDHLTVFLGSAGSWRLSAIQDAGGWRGDTQTEDIDLSFAAQIKGRKIVYKDDLFVKSRLPSSLSEFKLQQRSWMKGLMEVFRKRAWAILNSRLLSLRKKLFAIDFFLILPLQPLFIILGHLSLIPAYYFLQRFKCSELIGWLSVGMFILLCFTHVPFILFPSSGKRHHSIRLVNDLGTLVKSRFVSFGLVTFMFITLSYGLVEGICGVKVNRDRTLKGGSDENGARIKSRVLQHKILAGIMSFELIISVYSLILLIWAILVKEWTILVVFSIITVCYLVGAIASIATTK